MSLKYYNNNALEFFKSTIDVDMNSFYAQFVELLPSGARILDAGCGSGRDTLAFKKLGYEVTAIDASSELAALASEYSGVKVRVQAFDEVDEVSYFDGVWACASLLHVSRERLASNILCLARSLKNKGVLYASFKEGNEVRNINGRSFTDITLDDLVDLMQVLGLKPLNGWKTNDLREGREGEIWVNVLARKGE